MKATEFEKLLKDLIKEHGDLEVKGKFSSRNNWKFGPATIILHSVTNYATPKPYKKSLYFDIRHIDAEKDVKNERNL